MNKILFLLCGVCIFSPLIVFSQVITIGMSNALNGPTQELGQELSYGSQLYFDKYNRSEAGKKITIKVVSYDDGYEPDKALFNTVNLIEKDKVFALFNYVGTPTSKAILPLIQKYSKIYFAPYTGAEFLRDENLWHVYNIRASYYEESELQVKYFIDQLKLKNVALFLQADEFGLAGAKGITNSLKNRGIENFKQYRYKRNSDSFTSFTKELKNTPPDVIFCIGTYQPISQLINQIRKANITSKVAMLSFAGAASVQKRLNSFQDIYITTVVPNPSTSNLPIVKEYRRQNTKNPLNHESLEGYINAYTFTKILEAIEGKPTNKSFHDSAALVLNNPKMNPLSNGKNLYLKLHQITQSEFKEIKLTP